MLNFRITFVAIIIAALVFPPVYAADDAPALDRIPQYDNLIENITENISTFDLSEETQEALNNSIELETQETRSLGQQWFISSLKSFIAGFVLIGASEVRRRALERNLLLSQDNINQLSDQVTQDWTIFKQTLYSTGDATLMYIPSQGINLVTTRTVDRIVKSAEMGNILKSFLAGTVLSIGVGYINDMITVSARYVLDHPNQFGGLDIKEKSLIRLLQLRSGVTYYFHGLYFGGSITKKAYLKVFHALQLMLFHDSLLRETLWSHMTREALLKGSNATVAGLSVLSTMIATKYGPIRGLKGFGTSVLLALAVSEFMPTWIEDTETYAMRISYADLKGWRGSMGPRRYLNEMTNTSNQEQLTKAYLGGRRKAREYQMVMFASLMKLSLDRIDHLVREKKLIKEMHEAQGSNKYFYELMSGNVLPYDAKMKEEDKLVSYYENLYRRSSKHLSQIYDESNAEMVTLSSKTSGPIKDGFINESNLLKEIAGFFSYFITSLEEKWKSSSPSKEYWISRQALDQVCFWGLHESQILEQGSK